MQQHRQGHPAAAEHGDYEADHPSQASAFSPVTLAAIRLMLHVLPAASESAACLSATDAQWSLSVMLSAHPRVSLYDTVQMLGPICARMPAFWTETLSTRAGPDWDARRDVLGSLGFGESAGASFSVWMAPSGR